MNIQDFTYLLKDPSNINEEKTKQLETVISSFPYFQSARALHLKGLKNLDSFKYNQTLKTTAAYTTDRSILFDFITSSNFINTETVNNSEEVDVVDVETVVKENTEIQESESADNSDEILSIGKPLEFKKHEAHSFNEWLQLSTFKPIKRSQKPSEKREQFDIIDRFISANPKISISAEGNPNYVKNEPVKTDYNNLMTETLAQVYLEQKKYENAKKAYRILSLKYPEKSSFFADRIKAIEFLENK